MRIKWKEMNAERGLTLIEVIASVAILMLIIMTFVPLFTQSMRSTTVSSNIMDATYLAQTAMEEAYHLSTTYSFEEAVKQVDDMTFIGTEGPWYRFVEYKDGAYIELSMKIPEDELSNVLVKVYSDDSKSELKAQMETIYRWE
jgi:type II secretory pathway pseudopilin PulG